ncbi:MAG: GGDEF domain-containing protein [Spirochaetes bacterium]|nr:GGDEF domain-containing protein [Spirochaetota bacterium]
MNYFIFRIAAISLIALINLGMGILIIIKRKSKLNILSIHILLMAFFSFLFASFSVLYNLAFHFNKIQTSILFARATWVGAFILSSAIVVALSLNRPPFKKKYLYTLFFIPSLIVFLTALLTDKAFKGYKVIQNLPVTIGGEWEMPLRAVLFIMMISTIIIASNFLRKATGYKKNQLSYFIYGSFIYAAGGIIFGTIIPMLTPDLLIRDFMYDSHFLFGAIWIGFLSYAIIKYKMMEIETVFHKTFMWIIMSLALLLPLYLILSFSSPVIRIFSSIQLTFAFFILVILFSRYNNFLQPLIDKLFQKKKYNREKIFKNFIADLSLLAGLEELRSKIMKILKDNLYSENIVIFIYDNLNKNYYEFTSDPQKATYEVDHWFIKFIESNKSILEKELVIYDPKYSHIKKNMLKIFKKMKAELFIPFHVNYRLVGFMFLGKKINLKEYTLMDLGFLNMLISPISVAINNSITYNMAITDPLTGLYNRNFLFFVLEKEINGCKRYGSPLSLLFIDLDYLKKVNDLHGHEAGDICLKKLSSLIKEVTRDTDVCARYGGDEFIVVMPNTTLEGAMSASNRLLQSIKNSPGTINRKKLPFTASIGVAQYNLQYKDYNQLLIMADKALYKAKSKGRCRVELLEL